MKAGADEKAWRRRPYSPAGWAQGREKRLHALRTGSPEAGHHAGAGSGIERHV